jgi:hypothetical protein
VLFISMSLVGFFAKGDHEIGFLSIVKQENEDYA